RGEDHSLLRRVREIEVARGQALPDAQTQSSWPVGQWSAPPSARAKATPPDKAPAAERRVELPGGSGHLVQRNYPPPPLVQVPTTLAKAPRAGSPIHYAVPHSSCPAPDAGGTFATAGSLATSPASGLPCTPGSLPPSE